MSKQLNSPSGWPVCIFKLEKKNGAFWLSRTNTWKSIIHPRVRFIKWLQCDTGFHPSKERADKEFSFCLVAWLIGSAWCCCSYSCCWLFRGISIVWQIQGLKGARRSKAWVYAIAMKTPPERLHRIYLLHLCSSWELLWGIFLNWKMGLGAFFSFLWADLWKNQRKNELCFSMLI